MTHGADARPDGPPATPTAVLFDIDGCLISTGGAGARSWRGAFQELYGVPADIGASTEAGMTDPEVCARTFLDTIGRPPRPDETARVMSAYLRHLPDEVARSENYRVLDGVSELLPALCAKGAIGRAGVIHGHDVLPGAVFVVGDTPLDVAAGRGAGAVSVAVASGKYSVEELTATAADHVLPSLAAPFPGL